MFFCQLDAIGSFNIPSKFVGKVLEGFIQVIATLCRNLIVLQFLLHVESNLFGSHIHLVSTDYNRNVATYPVKIIMPHGHILLGLLCSNITQDNTTICTFTASKEHSQNMRSKYKLLQYWNLIPK
jgi:hypothetical protein